MKVLIVGNGGREHAIARALMTTSPPPELHVAPGNGGTRGIGDNVDVSASNVDALVELARDPPVLVQLYHPLANGTNDQKKHLAYVVSISGNKESLTHLERLTHDPDPKVAQEAIRAMGNLQARL